MNYYIRRKDELYHYGRYGMKWGRHIYGDDPRWGYNGRDSNNNPKKKSDLSYRVKRIASKAGDVAVKSGKTAKKIAIKTGKFAAEKTKEGAKSFKEYSKARAEAKRRGRDSKLMSDAEIKANTTRLELEKKYAVARERLKKDNLLVETGKRTAINIVSKSLENIGTQALTYKLGEYVNKGQYKDFMTKYGIPELDKIRDMSDEDRKKVIGKVEDMQKLEGMTSIVNPKKGQSDKKK